MHSIYRPTVAVAPSKGAARTAGIPLNLALSTLTQVAQKLPTVVVAMVLTRVFTKDDMGAFFFLVSLANFLQIGTLFGTGPHLMRAVAARPQDGLARLGEVLGLRIWLVALALGLMNGGMYLLVPELALVCLLISIYMLVGGLEYSFAAYLAGRQRFGLRLLCASVAPAILVPAVLVAVQAGASLHGVLLWYVVAHLAVLACAATIVHFRFGPVPIDLRPHNLRRVIGVCWPFFILEALQTIHFRIDTLMIFGLVSRAAVAQYETAYKFLEVSRLLARPVMAVIFPLAVGLAAAADWPGLRGLARRTLIAATAGGAALALLVGLTAGVLMPSVWGTDYAAGAPILRILYLSVPFAFLALIGSVIANALHRERAVIKLLLLAALGNVALNAVAIPAWGVLGAAWTTVATEMFLALAVGGLLIKVMRKAGGADPVAAPAIDRPGPAAAWPERVGGGGS